MDKKIRLPEYNKNNYSSNNHTTTRALLLSDQLALVGDPLLNKKRVGWGARGQEKGKGSII